ncbi:MAG: TonB-dependent receptor, partial [Bacteroidetes bacterium]|nr:TonB-dependent receptor [Bacteroidota bacterium]
MKTRISKLLSFLFLLVISGQVLPKTFLHDGDLPPAGKGSLEGRVLHKQTREPVEYATVVLFSLPDTVMFNGTVSNPDGIFLIENIPYGKYYLKVNFIGFNLYSSSEIVINQENKFIQLPAILLEPANISLEGIEVVADRSPIEYRIDKKVVNVSQDILASGGTAVDVLENTPSVDVDIEGNVALRGSGNFTVLIDGRPSVLEGSEALQQIPASTIENIEIITNPSAKYDPEGTAGIINVVTKKKKQSGLSGIVNASLGTKDKYEGDFLVNYRKNNVNLYGGMDFHSQHYPGNRETYREGYQNDTTYFLEQEGTRNRNRKGIGGRLGLDWNLSDQAVFGI